MPTCVNNEITRSRQQHVVTHRRHRDFAETAAAVQRQTYLLRERHTASLSMPAYIAECWRRGRCQHRSVTNRREPVNRPIAIAQQTACMSPVEPPGAASVHCADFTRERRSLVARPRLIWLKVLNEDEVTAFQQHMLRTVVFISRCRLCDKTRAWCTVWFNFSQSFRILSID